MNVRLGKKVILGTVLAVSLSLTGTAYADSVSGSVWENWGSSDAPATAPAGTPAATFIVTGTAGNVFSFYSGDDSNLNAFLTYGGSSVTYLTGSSAQNDGINNDIFEFTGSTYLVNGQTYTYGHDDGMLLYLTGNGLDNSLQINFPGPTSYTPTSYTFDGETGTYNFDLIYAEVAGPPAALIFDIDSEVTTPEPSSLLLLGTGLLLAAGLFRRQILAR